MNTTSTAYSTIAMFHTVEENLHRHQLDLALKQSRSILESDPKNFYAQTIERRLTRILSRSTPSESPRPDPNRTAQMVVAALRHICLLAIMRLKNSSEQDHSIIQQQ